MRGIVDRNYRSGVEDRFVQNVSDQMSRTNCTRNVLQKQGIFSGRRLPRLGQVALRDFPLLSACLFLY